MPVELAVDNSLCYFRPVTVAYVRRTGPVLSTIGQAWTALRTLLTGYDLRIGGPEPSYGLLHGGASDQHCTYDACIEIPADMEQVLSGRVGTQTVAGGVHIASDLLSSHRKLTSAIANIAQDPLVGDTLNIDPDRPAIITYSLARGRPDAKWGLSLAMPLRWNTLERAA